MSSSQDSDIDLEYQRLVKPKKFIPKLIKSIFVHDIIESPQKFKQNTDSKNKSKKTKTDASFQEKNTSITSNKFLRRAPIAVSVVQRRDGNMRNVKFDIKNSNRISDKRSSSSYSGSPQNGKKDVKLRFYQEDSQRWQETIQLFDGMMQQSDKITKITQTCRQPYKKLRVSRTQNQNQSVRNSLKLKQQTTPIFSCHKNRTQIIKEYQKEGNKIRTNWSKGMINGYTEIDYQDKGKFRGIFQQGDMISGQLTFPNGFVYTGQFSMYVFHGFGKLKFPSGQVFQGNWIFGYLSGNAKIIYPKGQIYYGAISNFRRDGQGYLYFQNGHKYVGQFLEGQITGYGQLHKQGILTHKGFWISGKFIGTQEEIYRKKKQQFQKQKKNKKKKKATVLFQLHQSLRQIKQVHQKLTDNDNSKEFTSDARVMGIIINQSSNIIYEEPKELKISVPNRVKKQISLSLKVI